IARRDASRTVANASSRRSSSVAPLSSLVRNSAVLPRSSASESFFHFSSRSLMRTTRGRKRLISRSWLVPKTFLMRPPIMLVLWAAVPCYKLRSLARGVLRHHCGLNAAAHRENSFDAQAPRLKSAHQVVEDSIGHRLVERALAAKRPQVQLERLELDAALLGDVADADGGEVGLTRHRAHAGELGALEADLVVALRARV